MGIAILGGPHVGGVNGHDDSAAIGSSVAGSAKIRALRPKLTMVTDRPMVRGFGPVKECSSGRVEQAVRTHLTLVWQVLRRAGLREADADDATQDVFWVFAQRLHDVPEPSTRAFLVATALRVASDKRKTKWNRSVTELAENDGLSASAALPDEQAHLRSQTQLLDQLLTEMSADEREIFILSEIEEMTRKEVADSLGIPEGTVASRLRRARESFERLLRRVRPRREPTHA